MRRSTTILLASVVLIGAGCGSSAEERAEKLDGGSAAAEGMREDPDLGFDPDSIRDVDPDLEGRFDGVPPEDPAGLPAYRRRCKRLDVNGARARIVYQPRKNMTRGDAETVTAAVTLDRSIPPEKILHRPGAVDEPGLLVSCRIQAQLIASKYEFEIDKTDWVERSLLGGETARWSWYVKPKVGGTQMLLLYVRPIVKIEEMGTTEVSAEDSNVQEYETSVHVNVPWSEKPAETMSQVAATLKVAEGLVQAMTLFVAAVVALLAALGIRRHKRKRAGPGADPTAAPTAG